MTPTPLGPGFHQRVYDVVRRVPPGRVTTYGDVALAAGAPRAARQVGYAMAALTPEQRHKNDLVMFGLHFAIIPDQSPKVYGL